MKDNLNYTEYNEEKNRVPWGRVLLSFLIIILAVIIVLLILKACGRPTLKNDIIDAAKEYYEINPDDLPTEVGECVKLSLVTLEEAGLVNVNDYATCDKEETYVNVCYLESKNYHYSAMLDCEVEVTDYDLWKDGAESDLTENSDVRFKYLGEEKKTAIKLYYPNNLTDITAVREYYAVSPNVEYTEKEDEQVGYKWYIEKDVNNYWNEGEYSSTQPSGYTEKGNSKQETHVSDVRPNEASYRTVQEINLYRYQKVAYPTGLISCSSNSLPGIIASKTPCHLRTDSYKNFVGMEYTCGGSDNSDITINTVCEDFTDWTTTKCENSVTNGINCESKIAYSYTDTKWQWYKIDTVKSYYPSGSSSANKENTYYLTSPTTGAIKDETTKAVVNKYYKLEESEETANYEEWLPVTDGYVTYEELIGSFNNLGYEVNSLKDINELDKIRYQYQLQYRNIEE